MIRWLIQLVTTPALIILRTLEWCVMYIVQYSGMLCRLVAGTIFVLATIGFATSLGSREYLIKILAVGFGILLIPQLGRLIVNCIGLAHAVLIRISRS